MIPSVQGQGASEFGTNVVVNDGTSPYLNQVEPTMTILSDGRILAGWKEAHTHNGPGRRVGFAYSTDMGATFSRSILMTPVTGGNFQSDPWLVSDHEDNAYFVWIEYNDITEDANPELIGVDKTVDGGITWEGAVNAEDTPHFDDKETACIDSNGTLYIVWDHLDVDGNGDITDWDLRFTKSVNGTSPFTPTKVLEIQPFIPYITCSPNDTLYISTINATDLEGDYHDNIYFSRSSDLGDNWSSPIAIPHGRQWVDIITVLDTDSNENVYLAYSAGNSSGTDETRNIFIINSTDGGRNWNIPVKVNDNVTSTNYLRMVEMYIGINDTIHIAWLDTRNDEYNIYYSYSPDGGTTFSEDERVSEVGFEFYFSRPGDYFCMRQDPVTGDMCIVWTDGRNGDDHDIYFARQGLFIPEPPPKWPILVGLAAFLVIVIVVLVILVKRKQF
jgi:Neuraminidase (sialidase)